MGKTETEYFIDASGTIQALKQVDVIEIVAEDLVPVVFYEYDSWGNLRKLQEQKQQQ